MKVLRSRGDVQVPLLFNSNYNSKARFIVNQGGTSSGKTFNINICLLIKATEQKNCVVTVVGQDMRNLKRGALRDMLKAITIYPSLRRFVKSFNITESVIYLTNGSLIEFVSYDDEQDAKNGKRDYAFFNEANGIPYQIAWQIIIRTSKQCYFDYNPTSAFWVHDKIIPQKGCHYIQSTHHDNPFLSDQQHEEIESIKDPELYRVYALGETGNIQGIIYPGWQMCTELPLEDECLDVIYGCDFGYSVDPTAVVKIMFKDRQNVYLQELCYETNLNEDQIKASMPDYRDGQLMYCDHDKLMILQLKRKGVMALNAVKGDRSVFGGILALRKLNIYYLNESENLHFERSRYKFRSIDGAITKEPDKTTPHHLLDAARYGIYSHLIRMGWAEE